MRYRWGKSRWFFAVARESINRKIRIAQCPENVYWTVGLMYWNECQACTSPTLSLKREAPEGWCVCGL